MPQREIANLMKCAKSAVQHTLATVVILALYDVSSDNDVKVKKLSYYYNIAVTFVIPYI